MDDISAKVADEIIDNIGSTTRMTSTVHAAIIKVLDKYNITERD